MAPGMMGGYGHGYGMGPGMMGGYGMGPEMMGGFGGGFGMGAGMMGPIWRLDLSDAQRSQIFKLQDESRRRNWELMGKLQDEYAKLRDAYLASGKRDRKAIVDAYKHIGDLRLQRIEVSLDTLDKLEAVLTPQQREQLKRWGPWWMRGAEQ
jgi:Spy/CpxP family protein refolding chaperone